MSKENGRSSVVVIGGGIAGIQATIDLANMGFHVYLVEKSPSIGGRMAQLDKTFPTNDCAMCILAPKMIEASQHPNVTLLAYSEVEGISGEVGNFTVKVRKNATYINWDKCTGCGECVNECPVELWSEFNQSLSKRKATYKPFAQAIPNKHVIDKKGVPPCRDACPAGVNAQGYIALISQGKFEKAVDLVRERNPLPLVCGRVCTHPCETECNRGKLDEPIAIARLKRFCADYELKLDKKPTPVEKTKKEKVAIIGSGPAGLTAAYYLAQMGYPLTIFEKLPEPGGMLYVGIPEYRLPKDILKREIEYIKGVGVEIKTGVEIGKDITLDQLSQEYDAVFTAVGAHESMKLNVPGEDLEGVLHGVTFLRELNLGREIKLGDRVAIIGGGNVAIDTARSALRLGSKEVFIVYRRSREEMPASDEEIEAAEEEGVKLTYLATPTKVLGKDGKVAAMECIRMELGEPDASGRKRPVPIEGSEFTIDVDTIIPAIGQAPETSFLKDGVELTGRGLISVSEGLATSRKGVFAGGDVVTGAATVVEAVAAGRRAAESIDRYLRGEEIGEEVKKVETVKFEGVDLRGVERQERAKMPEIPLERRRGNFAEVELGFTEEMAIEEAKRCLNCGGCSECMECERTCEAKAIVHDMKDERLELEAGAVILATGLDLYDPQNLSEYKYGKVENVVTALEFERLISASGPTSGELERPSDKKLPSTIAFIQCVGSRDLKHKPYCSSVCCMHATKEAILANEHHPETKSYIFYMDMRAVGKRFQEYITRAKQEYNVTYIRGRPGHIEVNHQNQNPIVWHEETTSGETKGMEVDLVVLCQALIPTHGSEELLSTLGVGWDEYGFVEAPQMLACPVDTTKPGIFACGCAQRPQDIPDSVVQASAAAARVAEVLSGGA